MTPFASLPGTAARPAWQALAAALLALGFSAPAAAEPSQSPLTTRTAAPPQPNLMITIDDSGSMLFDFMPEQQFKVNGYTVQLAESIASQNWPMGFPGDIRRTVSRNGYNYAYFHGVVPGDATAGIFQMQFRSPDVNAMYYNPDIRYQPWLDAGTVNSDMPAGVFGGAKWDPLQSGTLNLSKTTNSYTVNWCTAYNTCTSATKTFNPGLVYRLKAGADPTKTTSYVAYDLNGATFSPATKNASRTDCAGTKCTKPEEQLNFANWFTYYRMREAMTKAAIGRSIANYQDKIRVGWAQFNSADNGVVTKVQRIQQIVKPMDTAYLKSVLGNIYKISSFNGTPTRSVMDDIGTFFSLPPTDSSSPWLKVPGNTASGTLTCRRSAQFLMTDGYYNDTTYAATGNKDGSDGPDHAPAYPDPADTSALTRYKAVRPYIDAPTQISDTLADVAMKYFINDLQGSIANQVAPIEGDIAYWQHLSQYMVGLGVTGTLDSSTPAKKKETLAAITAGSTNWPDPSPAANSAQKIDDMWHAAVNTGGDFYSVKNVNELSAAIDDAVGKASGQDAREAGVAVSSGSVVTGTLKLVPKYKSVSWTGDLEAYKLDSSGNAGAIPDWVASTVNHDAAKKGAWPNSGKDRSLYTWSGSAPVAFVSTNSNVVNWVGSANLVDYVRGDTTNEGSSKAFRARAGAVFGDFIDSPPVYVKDQVSLGYEQIDASYKTYLTSKAARTTGVVFLGGNAGILHAFDGSTGKELYGYLPKAGLGNLSKIAAKDYGMVANFHRFFVDGPISETDAYIPAAGKTTPEWSNLVVGSMGAGGAAVFALQVPTTTPTTLGASTLRWELTDTDLGYVLGDIAVGKIQGGGAGDGWKAFIGNGVDSSSGKAVLLVVNLATGAVDKKIEVETAGGNGLMGVTLIKNSKNMVIGAYAGDLKGSVWRFEFGSATDSDTWKTGFDGKALFESSYVDPVSKTVTAQPITVAPVSVSHSEGAGRIVLFGTGKLIVKADATSLGVQSFYGVLDPTPDGNSSSGTTSPFKDATVDRDLLEVRVATTVAANMNGHNYFEVTGDPIDWKTQFGWYMDMPFAQQRVLYAPMILAGDYVLMQTMIPAADAAECSVENGKGYNYLLVARAGTQVSEPVFDTSGDGKVDEKDVVYGGWETSADGRDAVILVPSGGGGDGGGGGGGGGLSCKAGYQLTWVGGTPTKPQWLCLPQSNLKILDRVWRQVLNPPHP